MSHLFRHAAAALLLVALSPGAIAQPTAPPPAGGGRGPAPPPARFIGVALALEAAEATVASCTASGYNVSVSVLDAAGVTRLVYAADKAGTGAIDSATRKAYTSVAFKLPTADIATQQPSNPEMDAKIKADPKMFARAGAYPLLAGPELAGAIGVGGAPGGERDAACAEAGIAKIKDRIK